MTTRQFAFVLTYDDAIPPTQMEMVLRSLALLGCDIRQCFRHILLSSIVADGPETNDLIGSITMGMMGGAYAAPPEVQDLFWSAAEAQRRSPGV